MANDVEFRSFVSKVQFTRSINANNPGFLKRNLRHALHSHERELKRKGTTARADELAVMAERRRTRSHTWDFPSGTVTNELMNANKARIRIKSIVLQDPTKVAAGIGRPAKRSRPSEQPEWLQEPDQLRLPCQAVVTVNDARSQRRTIATAARQGTISRHGKSTFKIDFNEPFIISAGDLDVHTPSFTGTGQWRKALHNDYGMEFGIHLQDSDDTAEFLSQLEGRPVNEFLTAPGNEGIVKCSWSGLPGLPQAEEPHSLYRAKGHHRITLKYVAHIDMAWNKRESPLSTYNKVLRRARNEPRQLPTPSVDPETVGAKTMVKYTYQQGFETKGMPVGHLRCIFCTSESEHATFERLHLHYLTRHDHFQYEVRLEENENGDDLRAIRISHEDDRPTTNEREFEWEAPREPFDIAAHLEGTNSWTVRHTKKVTSKVTSKVPKEQPLMLARSKKRDTVPEEVEEMPKCRKKRHVVPRVPGVKFYRTKSKQSVAPGTELSDSEDALDETWLLQLQRKQRSRLGASKIALQFNELFNKHLDIEGQPQSDVLVRDAVIRFVREHARQLAQPGWKEEFDGKLKLFQSVNVVDAATVAFCQGKVAEWEHDLDGPTLIDDEDEEQPPRSGARRPRTPNRRIREDLPSQVRGTAAVFDQNKVLKEIPESPTSTASNKNRMRWAGGRMKPDLDPIDIVTDTPPLGHRTLICIRPATERHGEKSTGELPITEFVKDSLSQKPNDEIEPSDLDYKKFLRFLDNDLVYIRAVDNIVCISNATTRPVVDEKDWWEALKEVQVEGDGPIKFMVGELDVVMNSQGNTPRKGKRKEDVPAEKVKPPPVAATSTARQKKPCVCGEFVKGPRNTIGCGNPRCYRDFHMPCVQLQRRAVDWLCMDCSS